MIIYLLIACKKLKYAMRNETVVIRDYLAKL